MLNLLFDNAITRELHVITTTTELVDPASLCGSRCKTVLVSGHSAAKSSSYCCSLQLAGNGMHYQSCWNELRI